MVDKCVAESYFLTKAYNTIKVFHVCVCVCDFKMSMWWEWVASVRSSPTHGFDIKSVVPTDTAESAPQLLCLVPMVPSPHKASLYFAL